ncbi:MAG: hypothetical protein IGS03_12360 [Candidatus Sericytochromatia bacterium]|nr:hypothetical protein [Candidatus Sericytochromatia bacterium]
MIFRHAYSVFITSALSVGLLAGNAFAGITNPSPHRKVDGKGIGNCVFSDTELGFKQDSSYKLKSSFTASETVHVRCYFPQTLQEYKPLGKVLNELKENEQYWASLSVKGSNGYFTIDEMLFKVNKWESDQQRFDITGDASGDFGYEISRESEARRFGATVRNEDAGYYAVNLANYVKAMADSAGKYPYSANFCVDVFVKVADDTKTVEKINERTKLREWVNEPIIKQYLMAKSCFDYTIKSASDVNWTADDSDDNTGAANHSDTQKAVDEVKDLLKGLF